MEFGKVKTPEMNRVTHCHSYKEEEKSSRKRQERKDEKYGKKTSRLEGEEDWLREENKGKHSQLPLAKEKRERICWTKIMVFFPFILGMQVAGVKTGQMGRNPLGTRPPITKFFLYMPALLLNSGELSQYSASVGRYVGCARSGGLPSRPNVYHSCNKSWITNYSFVFFNEKCNIFILDIVMKMSKRDHIEMNKR